MCMRKPGRRCPSHAYRALSSAQRRHDEAVQRVETAQDPQSNTPPSRVALAQQRLADAKANLAAARVDSDSTIPGRGALLTALADDSLPKAKRQRLSARFQHAEALTEARANQRRFMPDLPKERSADMDRTYTTLGESRDSLARVEAQMSVTTDKKSRHRLEDQRAVLTQRVFAHDVQHRLAATGWRPDPAHVTPEEQRAARTGGMQVHQALTTLSHQRAAAASGGHDERFRAAVADAEAGFRRRYLPEQAAPARENVKRPAQQRAPQQRSRAGAPMLSSTKAKQLLRKAAQQMKGEKITPGKHQGDPLFAEPVD